MAAHIHEQRVPKGALLGAGALLLVTFALAAHARVTNASDAARAHAEAPAVVQQVELRFEDRSDGSVAVLEASTSREVHVVPPAEGGFVRGVMRGMFRTRKLESIPAQGHFRLTLYADEALVLEDPHSGRRVDLRSFGPTNEAAFSRMLPLPGGGAP